MVTAWINQNGIGSLSQYDVPAIVKMAQKWADEDTNGIVSALPAQDIADIVESHRGAAA
jgi:hypothetical protein